MSINATSLTAASDEPFKTMHGTYDHALEEINTLKLIKFIWKTLLVCLLNL
jgi:hypothetical protein